MSADCAPLRGELWLIPASGESSGIVTPCEARIYLTLKKALSSDEHGEIESLVMRLDRWRMASVLMTVGLAGSGMTYGGRTDPTPPHRVHHPKPASNRDSVPFLPQGSATSPTAPTLGVIGDSVARDYAYYLARELGPAGVRVVDAATSGCAAGAVLGVMTSRGGEVRLTWCPDLTRRKQATMVNDFHPRIVVWHSIQDRFDIVQGERRFRAGTAGWERQIMAAWDETLARVTSGGAQVLLLLPLWWQDLPAGPQSKTDLPLGPLRDLYRRWAAGHPGRVTVVDIAPLVCPSGPPCRTAGGFDFRPDGAHYEDPGGTRVAAYLRAHVPALTHLVPRPAGQKSVPSRSMPRSAS
ncbi:hypothetical protein GCM10010151_02130 [Actinoallomurus spadix]|uniref:SGNH domain-containing protein n=2 Tax=Actinoallomurus spadix TaxID=79912 RepID=A0ABP3FDV5_9ACTN